MSEPWTGSWVTSNLGVEVTAEPPEAEETLRGMVGLALRRNPKRPHLLVSNVLGKHVPTKPQEILRSARLLGERVAARVGSGETVDLVLGYAETATSLGHLVSDVLDTSYVHSTRREDGDASATFEETHSHASGHRLVPDDESLLRGHGALVLVDDELSTGRTVRETIRALHRLARRGHYVVAALLDLRCQEDRVLLEDLGESLGVRIDVVSLVSGQVRQIGVPSARIAELVAEPFGPHHADPPGQVVRLEAEWPVTVPPGGRHGFGPHHRAAFDKAIAHLGRSIASLIPGRSAVHVLGHEELMYLPLRLASNLEQQPGSPEITFSSTTRSPVVVLDEPGYAVQHGLTFPAHDRPEDTAPRFAYNLKPGRFGAIVFVTDDRGDTPEMDDFLELIRGVTPLVVLVVVPAASEAPQ